MKQRMKCRSDNGKGIWEATCGNCRYLYNGLHNFPCSTCLVIIPSRKHRVRRFINFEERTEEYAEKQHYVEFDDAAG